MESMDIFVNRQNELILKINNYTGILRNLVFSGLMNIDRKVNALF